MDKTVKLMFDYIVANPNKNELEIARGVGLKKTPYTRKILLSMWNQGYVIRWWDDQTRPASYRYFVQLTQPMEDLK